MNRYDALVEKLRAEIPGFRVVQKRDSRLQRAIDRALRIVTFGQMRDYLESYQTTIGRTVYVTSDWDRMDATDRYITLRHEAVHLRQFRRLSLPIMAIVYLLLPLPIGLAYGRARLEWAAYAESIRAAAEVYGKAHPAGQRFRAHIVEQFLGPSYGWMWPFRRSVERWYDRTLASL